MAIQEVDYVWKNGQMIPWADATTHIMTHGLLYGTCVFEGTRAYETPHKGTCIFRNTAHNERLIYSGSVYRIDVPFTIEEMNQACRDVVAKNGLKSAYLRTNCYMGYGEVGPSAISGDIDTTVVAFPWGTYLGADALNEGVDVCVSSWRRMAPGTVPAGVKAAGNYLSSRLITMEAKDRGCVEGIGLTHDGFVSEGAGENLFLVKNGKIYTPPMGASILGGITRDSVLTLARALGYDIQEQQMTREMLYAADELFFSGTAAEVTPIRKVDHVMIGSGDKPVTKAIQKMFFGLFNGETTDEWDWLDPVE